MALIKTIIRFPIFAPPPNQPHHPNHRTPTTVIRFSRWNNANAQKFIRHERTQKEIEDQLRFHKRFDSADKIATIHQTTPTGGDAGGNPPTFKSTGTPSTPSRPSIPGKKSKYSKPPQNPQNPHPAFRRTLRIRQIPNQLEENKEGLVKVGDNGVSYLVPEAPFEFQYSYTETPKAKPLKLREPPIAPFGPGTMPRPWTGRKPLPPSKKKLEFDSFRLPPPNKKGVKPVQAPGPFLPGTGPKYVQSREEVLGEPLRKDEVDALIKSCLKTKRQLNMGRDGLTHNMLDNIHAHWKRRRVCKIKCKGVCTVDMDNVRQQLEEKTGGKIIFSKGGVIYLFRGRNYNYKTRPIFPLMLWKPVTPVYPRLIQRAPEGLTLEEATEMRKKGRELIPICKLGKNGVYCDLVDDVREAFEACELVRINCQGMNGSDYRKIGAKLKDLVPCVLISFEHEHILMWRGRDWKSTILEDEPKRDIKTSIDAEASIAQPIEDVDADNRNKHENLTIQEDSNIPFINDDSLSSSIIEKADEKNSTIPKLLVKDADNDDIMTYKDMTREEDGNNQFIHDDSHSSSVPINTNDLKSTSSAGKSNEVSESGTLHTEDQLESSLYAPLVTDAMLDVSENISEATNSKNSPWTEGVLSLLKEAVEAGNAVVLDDSCLDADIVYERAVSLAQTAAPGPVFKHRHKMQMTVVTENQEATETKGGGESEEKEVVIVSEKTKSEKKPRVRRKGPNNDYLSVAPKGSLRVDELAKLLA